MLHLSIVVLIGAAVMVAVWATHSVTHQARLELCAGVLLMAGLFLIGWGLRIKL